MRLLCVVTFRKSILNVLWNPEVSIRGMYICTYQRKRRPLWHAMDKGSKNERIVEEHIEYRALGSVTGPFETHLDSFGYDRGPFTLRIFTLALFSILSKERKNFSPPFPLLFLFHLERSVLNRCHE